MKKLMTSAAMLLCSLLTFAQFSGSGAGTESDPYLILNPIQLNQMRNFLNKEKVYFKLMADINLTEFIEDEDPSQGWQPVGTNSSPFKGIFDGNGNTISGLWINRPNTDYVGLWGDASGATITNLTLKANKVVGNNDVGLLAGIGYGSINNITILSGSVSGQSYIGGCTGQGDVKSVNATIESVTGVEYVGGIAGYGDCSDCFLKCEKVKGNNYVGGISGCGEQNGCTAYTNIEGNECVGGIVGESYGNLTDCGFIGDITAHSYIGGICGNYNLGYYTPTTSKCFVIGHITGLADYVGGLIGYSNRYNSNITIINNCYFSGSVYGNNQVGGIVGFNVGGSISHCYSNASISGTKSIGGLCGKIENMNLLANVAIVTSVKATVGSVGRIYGEKGNYVTIGEMGTANENKALNRAVVIEAGIARDIVNNEQDGTGASPTTLKLKATYVAMGWDFTDTWDIQETECYPYFKKQTAPPVILSDVVSGATVVSGKCVDGGTVTLEIDGVKQQKVSTNQEFSFIVSPLQAGHEVRLSAKADGKEQSYYTTQVVSYLGKGTEADPYQVYTAADLACVYRKGYYKLMNDIDLTSYINQFSPEEGWESIGREGSETIHLDGDGHKVTGLWCNSTRDNTGLFSCFANGYIKNLTVETANGKQVKGGNYTGILIGKLINGEIDNCSVSGTVADGSPVGGMVGKLDGGKILRSQTNVTIRTEGENTYTGGLVGELNGQVDQCLSAGLLTAIGAKSYVGGLVGCNDEASTVTNSYSTATVSSTYNASGLVAYNYGVIDKCYAMGNIFTKNYGAGIVGYNDGEAAVVKNCVAMNNKIEVVYESQQVEQGGGYGQRIIGGIKNGAPAPEMNNYALKTMQVSVNNVPQKVYDDIMNGVAKTQAELTQQTTYTGLGWDFSEVWTIDGSYPYLKKVEPATGFIITKGDLNGDGTIDILDIILIIDVMTGELTDAQKKAAADVNGDGDVDILDIISAIDLMITQGSAGSRMDKMSASMVANDFFSASMQNGEVMVSLNNQNRYTAFQMVVNVPEGVSISDAKISGERGNKHQIALRQLNEQQYLLMGFSADNSELTGNDGQLFSLTIEGMPEDEIVFSNVQFATTKAEAFRLAPVSVGNATTDIQEISEQQARQAYDLQGRKANGQLKKGLYIVNGKKINQK